MAISRKIVPLSGPRKKIRAISGTCEWCGAAFSREQRHGPIAKRSYCSESCRVRLAEQNASPAARERKKRRYKAHVVEVEEKRSLRLVRSCLARVRSCVYCGARFDPGCPARRIYCSSKCRDAARIERRKHPSEHIAKTRRRYAEVDAGGCPRSIRQKLLRRWQNEGRPCWACGGPCETIDHLIPITRGGTNWEGNLAPACRACNASRCNKLIIEWQRRPVGRRDA